MHPLSGRLRRYRHGCVGPDSDQVTRSIRQLTLHTRPYELLIGIYDASAKAAATSQPQALNAREARGLQ